MKLEIYKCAMLTIIAVLLTFITWKVQSKHIGVIVESGTIDVNSINETVDVQGLVDVDNVKSTVDVEGTVQVTR